MTATTWLSNTRQHTAAAPSATKAVSHVGGVARICLVYGPGRSYWFKAHQTQKHMCSSARRKLRRHGHRRQFNAVHRSSGRGGACVGNDGLDTHSGVLDRTVKAGKIRAWSVVSSKARFWREHITTCTAIMKSAVREASVATLLASDSRATEGWCRSSMSSHFCASEPPANP
jgi:hypothetical protein